MCWMQVPLFKVLKMLDQYRLINQVPKVPQLSWNKVMERLSLVREVTAVLCSAQAKGGLLLAGKIKEGTRCKTPSFAPPREGASLPPTRQVPLCTCRLLAP